MGIELHRTLQFQQGDVILKCGWIVLTVNYYSLDIFRDGSLALQVSRDVEFSHDRN